MIRSVDWMGIKFIACREACVLVPYLDGKRIETYLENGVKKEREVDRYSSCFGTLELESNPHLTPDIAFRRLIEHIRSEVDTPMQKRITAELNQDMWNAVGSLTYQSGAGVLRTVGPAFNKLPPTLALITFAMWGRGNPGLTARRIREMIMGLDGYYGDVSQYRLYEGPPHDTQPKWTAFPSAIPNI